MARILPSLVQDWVTKATAEGLAPRSVRKYHVMLHSIFERAVRDQLILINPCEHTELPKVIVRRTRTLTPDEFGRLITAIPERHRLMVSTAIETGMRWGELIALRPRHIDFLRRTVTVEETIVEVSKKHSGTGERMIVKPYPKDNESRTFGVRSPWLEEVAEQHQNPWDWSRRTLVQHRGRHSDLAEHVPHPSLVAGCQSIWHRLRRPDARSPPRARFLASRRRR
jgi:integrase